MGMGRVGFGLHRTIQAGDGAVIKSTGTLRPHHLGNHKMVRSAVDDDRIKSTTPDGCSRLK